MNNDLKAGLTAAKPADGNTATLTKVEDGKIAVAAQSPPSPGAGSAKALEVPSIDAMKSAVTAGSTAYRIGSLDVLEVTVFKVPELSRTVQVSDAGTVSYPLLGELPAAGKTAQELEREFTKQLTAKYMQKPQVSVLVKEYNSQRVLLDGAVTKPGLYPVQGKSSLMQMIATSGGLMPNAENMVVVFRTVDGKRSAARFDIEEIRSGQSQDPAVQAGDVIVVNNSAMKEGFEKFIKLIPLAGVFAVL